MLQDIAPEQFSVEYRLQSAGEDSILCFFRDKKILGKVSENGTFSLPRAAELPGAADGAEFLFSISARDYFRCSALPEGAEDSFQWLSLRRVMNLQPRRDAFAACTAYHLAAWYAENRFCGRCGHGTVRDEKERALLCPECGHIVYPRINPAIIVGVVDGEHLLVTKYAAHHGPTQFYALVAGFCEIGESAEDTVRREVFEEVGLRVKNIRYYGSQPWGIDGNLSLGFFAELDGSDEICMEEDELSQALWVSREEVPQRGNTLALTSEMMEAFRTGKE